MCQWRANRNAWVGYRMSYPKLKGRNSVTTDWAHHLEPSSGLITIVVITLYPHHLSFHPLMVFSVVIVHFWLIKQGCKHDLYTRSSPHIATRQPHILCSICFRSFGTFAKAVRLFIASLHNWPMYPKMCSNDLFVKLKPVGWNLKGGLFEPWFGEMWGLGMGPFYDSIPRQWVPVSSPLIHMVYE